MSHEIVPFSERTIQLAFPECLIHLGQRCKDNCNKCNVPVCLKCIAEGAHKRHEVEKLINIVHRKNEVIKNDTKEIETKLIPKYEGMKTNAEKATLDLKKEFCAIEKETNDLRVLWHEEVDSIFDTLCQLNQFQKDKNLDILKTYQTNLEKTYFMHQAVLQNKQIITSSKASKINSYVSNLQKYKDVPEKQIKLPLIHSYTDQEREYSFVTDDFMAKLIHTSPACLSNVSCLKKSNSSITPRVLATIGTQCDSLYSVACIGDEVWISGQSKIKTRMDIHGLVKDSLVTTCQTGHDDISVTPQGQLIYTDLISPPKNWILNRLCCTKSGDILIHMNNANPGMPSETILNKVVRYQRQKITQEIDKDEHGNAIFSTGYFSLHMAENHNGDICVSDCHAKSVVVVEKTNRVRFRYDGTQAKRKEIFYPRYIVTDSRNKIIVTDFNNDCLHIIDQNGYLVSCVDNCGLYKPCGLSVDKGGRLWVGLYDAKKLKVLRYYKHAQIKFQNTSLVSYFKPLKCLLKTIDNNRELLELLLNVSDIIQYNYR